MVVETPRFYSPNKGFSVFTPRSIAADSGNSAIATSTGIDIIVSLFVFVTFLFGLGWLHLVGADEGRHAMIAREMVSSGNFLTPTIEGLPYVDKPVLFHWLVAVSTSLFGSHAFAVRLPAALAAVWTVFVAARWADLYHGRVAARLTAVLLSTSLLVFGIAHSAIIDSLMTALLATAMWRLGTWFLSPPHDRPSLVPAFALLGLGLLAKGPIAVVLPGLVFVAMVCVTRRPQAILEIKPIKGLMITALVAVPWYFFAWRASPDYIETFLLHHNIARYTTAGVVGHIEPWWYYPVLFPVGLLPWVFVAVPAVVNRVRELEPVDLYPLVWAGVVVAFFLPSQAKLITYLLPAVSPLAVVTAGWLAQRWRQNIALSRAATRLTSMWVGILSSVIIAASIWGSVVEPELVTWLPTLLLTLLLALAAMIMAAALWREGSIDRWLSAVCVLHLALLVFFVGPLASFYNIEISERPVAEKLVAEVGHHPMLRSYGVSTHATAWYSGVVIPRFRNLDELDGLIDQGLDAIVVKTKHLAELDAWLDSGYLEEVWRNKRANRSVLVVRDRESGVRAGR
ncbi:MAG: 4-amino-4-deoxy-L-arabinose transferase-like glycosyltransferase [Hyphomicrobiaceae bacterium]